MKEPNAMTEAPNRSEAEKRADLLCNAIEEGNDEQILSLVWIYFRDGKDELAFRLLQIQKLDKIFGRLDEIEITLKNFTDEPLNVNTYEQNG